MNKEEIFEKLNELDLDKEKYIVISGASLTVQGITSISSDIDLSCSEEYYKTIDWETKNGYFNTEIKYRDCYEIGTNFYDTDNIVVINGYKFMNLDACLELKKLGNKKKDQKLIKKLDLELCLKDNYRYERKLKETLVLKGKRYTYRNLMQLEVQNFKNEILNGEKYKPYKYY